MSLETAAVFPACAGKRRGYRFMPPSCGSCQKGTIRMKKQLPPEEERQIAREIDKALHIPDEEPRENLQPQAIVRLLQERPAVHAAPTGRRRTRLIAAAGALAACVAVALAVVLTDFVHSRQTLPIAESTPAFGSSGGAQPEEEDAAQSSGTAEEEKTATQAAYSSRTAVTEAVALPSQKATRSDTPAAVGSTRGTGADRGNAGGEAMAGSQTNGEVAADPDATAAEGASTAKPNATAGTAGTSVTANAGSLADWLAQGAILLDVRSAAEFEQGHPEGAVSLPADQIDREAVSFDLSATLILYGDSQAVSDAAARLSALGYTHILSADLFTDDTE